MWKLITICTNINVSYCTVTTIIMDFLSRYFNEHYEDDCFLGCCDVWSRTLPEHSHLHAHHHENLKSQSKNFLWELLSALAGIMKEVCMCRTRILGRGLNFHLYEYSVLFSTDSISILFYHTSQSNHIMMNNISYHFIICNSPIDGLTIATGRFPLSFSNILSARTLVNV
jgi:hypothetical protein